MSRIGILGGTFDPIHNGHIQLALEAQQHLNLDQVRLIPVNIPPHRSSPIASTNERIEMLELAIGSKKKLFIDKHEVENDTVSYTINTLKFLRDKFNDDALSLILGRDAFNKIDKWKNWQELLDYVHIIVANRPDETPIDITDDLQHWIEKHQTSNIELINNKLHGNIYFISIPMLDISSSMIRQLLSEKESTKDFLPENIQTYIKNNKLYLDT
ncbi:MAG: nicotinate-nucleotide adenylyltransferase [Pseudomonadota bacterium]